MPGPSGNTLAPPGDRSRALLDWAHAHLVGPGDSQGRPDEWLAGIAKAGACEGAGLAELRDHDARIVAHVDFRGVVLPPELPWHEIARQREWLDRVQSTRGPVATTTTDDESVLAAAFGTADGRRWLVWLADEGSRRWSPWETAAFALTAHTLDRLLSNENSPAAAELAKRQARLEQSAEIVHRLAHDFGNILTGILGFSELSLSVADVGSPLHGFAVEIRRAAQQGVEFMQALRWFSRSGAAVGESSALSEAVAQEQQRLLDKCPTGVDVRCNVARSIPAVAVESEALHQVLRQVLENARDALPSGGTIALTTRTTELTESDCRQLYGGAQPAQFVELQVADTGSGFSAEALERLFAEPFFSTKPRRRGLGLAIVYGILRSCRGGLTVANGLRGGAVVRLYFPVAVKPEIIPEVSVSPPSVAGNRVLVVDDDPMVLQLVCATLQQAGYGVKPAASGDEALASYTARGDDGFDLVLSDVLMPGMNGIDLARQLLVRDAEVNVLFMSGQVKADFPEPEFQRGQFEMLSKPFRPDGLLRAVRSALDRRLPPPDAAVGEAGAVPYLASS